MKTKLNAPRDHRGIESRNAGSQVRIPAPRISSAALLDHGKELIIEHAGREYRLRLTSSGKLILTA